MSDNGSPCTHLAPGSPAGFLGELLELCPLRALLGHVERLPLLAERLRTDLAVLKKKEKHMYLCLKFVPLLHPAKYQIQCYCEIIAMNIKLATAFSSTGNGIYYWVALRLVGRVFVCLLS